MNATSARKEHALQLFEGLPRALRPRRRPAQLRPGPPLAPRDGAPESRPARMTGCSMWPRARAWWPPPWSGATAARSSASTRARRCSPGRGRSSMRTRGWQSAIELVRGEAESLPFGDGEFDHLTFTYLLRYVDDPGATLRELARVVKPGGRIASLEFMLPPNPPARSLWRALHARRHASSRSPDLARLVRGRPLPRPEHQRSLRATAARPPARALARGRDRAACGHA